MAGMSFWREKFQQTLNTQVINQQEFFNISSKLHDMVEMQSLDSGNGSKQVHFIQALGKRVQISPFVLSAHS